MKFFKHPVGVQRPWVSKSLNLCKFALAGMVLLNMQASAAEAPKANAKSNISFNLNFDKLTGKVVDEKGEPLVGVSIRIKGTTTGTQTDANGNFSLDVQPNTVLILSYIGFANREVAVGGKTTLTITLTSNTNLNEVVVTALGIKKDQRKVGYAVSTVKSDVMDKARESNVALSLEGRVAGLNVSGATGGPGSSARVLLRGAASQSASSPLYVINGVPLDNTQRGSASEWGGADYGDGISNINPDDIETMTVLKGSAASALYGARAANGVILITTKQGEKNSKTSVEYNTNLSFDKAVDNTDWQYVYGQGSQNKRPTDVQSAVNTGNSSWGEKLDGAPTIALDGKMHPYSAVTNNIDKFYRTAPAFTNTLSVSGGSDKGVFRLSASNLTYQSILPNSGLNRKTFDLSAGYDITSKLNVSFNGNYVDEQNKNRAYLSDSPLNANFAIASLATSLDQKLLAPGFNSATNAETAWSDNPYSTNPYFVINKLVNNVSRRRFISSTAAKYKFTDWMFLQARMGYDVIDDNVLSVTPTGTAYSNKLEGGLGALNKITTTELNTDVLFSANHKIVKDLTFDFSAGANYRKRQYDLTGINGGNFIVPYLYTPSNLRTTSYNYSFSKLETQSAYYTVDFNYKTYLTLGTTGRYDMYSTLPSDNRGIFVPAVSGSFLFSELTKGAAGLSYGKLRASYAKTSGEPFATYTTFTAYSLTTPINGVVNGTFSRDLPNAYLKPYTTAEFEIGTELKWFQDRLGLDFAFFHRNTVNEISQAQISIASGFNTHFINLGKTRNVGQELNLTGVPIKTKDFSWNVGFNITHVKNTVLDIDGSTQYQVVGNYRPLNANTAYVVGKPILQIMAYDYKRDASGNIVIGADGVPVRGDLKAMGNTLPTVYGGLNNDFHYKNFTLGFLIDYKFGNKILSATEDYSYGQGLNKATLVGRETGVVADGVTASGAKNTVNVPAYSYYGNLASNISALAVEDARFIKFRQATLGYTFGQQLLSHTPFRAISVNLVGRNLFTIMKKTHNIDPESNFSSALSYSGIEGASLPFTRTYGVSANFKFK
ncbi:SusC/RagA family TonB-linked outer membrane protein [Mucilaginibacter sp. CAU 1740]|uniref:SusC/RagA family TonB-linked outer membrane protein n=1 Tax=Mucilaginibacter sp. CAU 1740 TaxID=3140365 RepID=UPI00325A8637